MTGVCFYRCLAGSLVLQKEGFRRACTSFLPAEFFYRKRLTER